MVQFVPWYFANQKLYINTRCFCVSTTESEKFKFYAEFNLVYCRNYLFQFLLDKIRMCLIRKQNWMHNNISLQLTSFILLYCEGYQCMF